MIEDKSEDAELQLKQQLLKVLSPLVRIYLNQGLAVQEVYDVLKHAYIEEAAALGENGTEASIAQIAARTGINRNEVARIKKLEGLTPRDLSAKIHNRLEAVVNGWVLDEEFHDKDGKPMTLRYLGEGKTFQALAKKYSRGIPHPTVLKDLIAVNVVKKQKKEVVLLKTLYSEPPSENEIDNLARLASNAADLINTISYNLSRSKSQSSRFQQSISWNMPPSIAKAFKDMCVDDARSMRDKWLGFLIQEKKRYESKRADDIVVEGSETLTEPRHRVGVGIYLFDDDLSVLGQQDHQKEDDLYSGDLHSDDRHGDKGGDL